MEKSREERVQELVEWATRLGLKLPRPAQEIVALEEQGHAVDLESGDILWNEGEARYGLTVVGEATLHLQGMDGAQERS